MVYTFYFFFSFCSDIRLIFSDMKDRFSPPPSPRPRRYPRRAFAISRRTDNNNDDYDDDDDNICSHVLCTCLICVSGVLSICSIMF